MSTHNICFHGEIRKIIFLDFFFSTKKYGYFSYSSTKTYVVDTQWECLDKVLLMRTHNLNFHGEI